MTQAKIYIPKTADNHGEAVDVAKRYFSSWWGGFTAYGEGSDSVVGGWVDPETDELVEEPVVVIETVSGDGDPDITVSNAEGIAERIKRITGEDAVMASVDGEKVIV